MRGQDETEQRRHWPDDGPRPVFGKDETSSPLEDETNSPLLVQFVAQMHGLGQRPAHTPSDELAAMLAGALPLGRARRRRIAQLRRRALFAMVAVAATVVSLTGVAASNDGLPQPAERFVSRVVNRYTPFRIHPSLRPTPVPASPAATHPRDPGESAAPLAPPVPLVPVAPRVRNAPAAPVEQKPSAPPSAPAGVDGPAGDDASAPDNTPSAGAEPSPRASDDSAGYRGQAMTRAPVTEAMAGMTTAEP